MSTSYCRIHFSLWGIPIKNSIERVTILSIIDHGVIMFEIEWMSGWSKSTEHPYILSIIYFIYFRIIIIVAFWILIKSRLNQWLRQLNGDLSDWFLLMSIGIHIFARWLLWWGCKRRKQKVVLFLLHRYIIINRQFIIKLPLHTNKPIQSNKSHSIINDPIHPHKI